MEQAKEEGKIDVTIVNDDEQNFRLLLKGRIDLIPMNLISALELLRTKFPQELVDNIRYHPKPASSRPGYVIFPKNLAGSTELVKHFNAGLRALRQDGTYEKMHRQLLEGYYSQ